VHALGIQISIDDFRYRLLLAELPERLPISKIKIDQSFIRDIVPTRTTKAIANAVISLGHSLEDAGHARGSRNAGTTGSICAHQGAMKSRGTTSATIAARGYCQLVRESLAAAKQI